MKKTVSTLMLAALCSCSAFSDTPDIVLEGQRGVYQGVAITQQNYTDLIDRYERDTKSLVTYHNNYIYEQRIVEVETNEELTIEQRATAIVALESERDLKNEESMGRIDSIVAEFEDVPLRNFEIIKLLTETVYNYLSTSPIQFDDINYWIKELDEATANNG